MLAIPVELGGGHYTLFILLDDENLGRIQERDPATMNFSDLPAQWQGRTCGGIVVAYANRADLATLREKVEQGRMFEGLREIIRNYAWRPDRGDGTDPEHVASSG